MTNKEKFKEVFGFVPYRDNCPMPKTICLSERDKSGDKYFSCRKCAYFDWWNVPYKAEVRNDYV